MSRRDRGKSTPVLAVDTGGTFTDLLLLRDGRLSALKLPSTPTDPAEAILRGIGRLFEGGVPEVYRLILGFTVATNTLLERDGARVMLVTNEGFEDVIEIGRQNRPQLYALTGHRPRPLVARSDRIGIPGRLDHLGREIVPLDPDVLRELPGVVAEAEAIAIVLLHSYANPDHERAVENALSAVSVPVSASSSILPEFREFERTSTTVANAYVGPRVRGYLTRLEAECGADTVRVMGSNGGALNLARSLAEPVHTVLSGPAGGVVGALDWARRVGLEKVLSFDMGGTSTDVSLVSGTPRRTREGEVGGVPIAVPLLDIHTVGAGGGSIAFVDPAGALRVGPRSAGAEPGPICYGRGGDAVTVTDAHVWLGRLPVGGLVGGAEPLDRAAIEPHLRTLGNSVGLSPEATAEGVIEIANTAMERALRVISVERGLLPSDFHLVAFGGAAGLHAAELTDRLGLRGALIPPDPGLLSAYGMLVAPVVRDRARTVLLPGGDPGAEKRIAEAIEDLERQALDEMLEDGTDPDAITLERTIDARYQGQSFELTVSAEDWVEAFHEAHETRYGFRGSSIVEAVTVRVRAEAPGEDVQIQGVSDVGRHSASMSKVWIEGSEHQAAVIGREDMAPGSPIAGPAIVVEYSATTWCPPGWRVHLDRWGALHLSSGPLDSSGPFEAT